MNPYIFTPCVLFTPVIFIFRILAFAFSKSGFGTEYDSTEDLTDFPRNGLKTFATLYAILSVSF